jgi:tetratricopeptide (TPR) repeat protein
VRDIQAQLRKATTLVSLSNRLGSSGKVDEAINALNDAIGIFRALALHDPDEFLYGLSMAQQNLANQLLRKGRVVEAHSVIEEAFQIRSKLVKLVPSYADALINTAITRAQVYARKPDVNGAVKATREGLEVLREPFFTRSEELVAKFNKLFNLHLELLDQAGQSQDLSFLRPFADRIHALNHVLLMAEVDRKDFGMMASDPSDRLKELLKFRAMDLPQGIRDGVIKELNELSERFEAMDKSEKAREAVQAVIDIYRSVKKPDDHEKGNLEYFQLRLVKLTDTPAAAGSGSWVSKLFGSWKDRA